MCTLLEDFFNSMNRLSIDGLKVVIKGKEVELKVFLAFCIGDRLALNWLGGFLQGVGTAIRCCRTCEINIVDRKELFQPSKYSLRTLDKHKQQLKMIDCMPSLSTTFGVLETSCLMSLNDFNLCESLLQDPMHVLIEGVCIIELSCLLNHLITTTNLSFLTLNGLIKTFNYAKDDKNDLPNEFDKTQIEKQKFRLSSGQMIVLFQNLPLILKGKIRNDDLNWQNFIRLHQILNLSLMSMTATQLANCMI